MKKAYSLAACRIVGSSSFNPDHPVHAWWLDHVPKPGQTSRTTLERQRSWPTMHGTSLPWISSGEAVGHDRLVL